MKIYISGKISKLPMDEVKENFQRGEALARNFFSKYCGRGYILDIINPLTAFDETGLTYDECMRQGIKLICDCAGMFMLNNWEDSKDAIFEHDIATRLHLAIAYENDKETTTT